jgi:hypothetical protein
MLSLEELKEIDPDLNLTDKELEEIREKLYELGQLAFEVWLEERQGGFPNGPVRVSPLLDESSIL